MITIALVPLSFLPTTPPLPPPQPILTHSTLPPLCCLPTEVRAECRHLWPSPAFSGLHCPGLIVLRDVDNHNRRRAGVPQSSREMGQRGGVLRGSFCFKCQAFSVGVLWRVGGGWEDRVVIELTSDLKDVFRTVVSQLFEFSFLWFPPLIIF